MDGLIAAVVALALSLIPPPALDPPPNLHLPDTFTDAQESAQAAPVVVPVSDIQAAFSDGWRAAGGSEAGLVHMLQIVWCESRWQIDAYNPVGPFHGLAQFLPSTWEWIGGGDIHNPWQQGFNAALLYHGYGAGHWPVCQYS